MMRLTHCREINLFVKWLVVGELICYPDVIFTLPVVAFPCTSNLFVGQDATIGLSFASSTSIIG